MGLLFDTEFTIEVVNRLDRRFNQTGFAEVRSTDRLKALFDPAENRALRQISVALGIHPGRSPTDEPARRWWLFLLNLHDKRDPRGARLGPKIRALIWEALDSPGAGAGSPIVAIKFCAVEGTPEDIFYEDVSLPAEGQPRDRWPRVRTIVLQTLPHIGNGIAPDEKLSEGEAAPPESSK
ncbi:MAG: hypothetical protein KIT81_05555 [Alphaproteobacteria bacterium]|nr:hypothetical protein [Alphaproteobacteria bacterium]